MLTYTGLLLLSAASLAFEVTLTRLFSVAQFYHFAFMVVSLALLGYGASGTFLALRQRSGQALRQRLKEGAPLPTLTRLSWGFALAAIGSYALTLFVPFDSFRVARDWRQAGVLLLHYVALATPFFCSGAAVGLLMAAWPGKANRVYAANLIGSALGCVIAVTAPSLVGGEGSVLLSTALGLLAALVFQIRASNIKQALPTLLLIPLLIIGAFHTPPFLQVRLSPYKSLSYALLYPDAELIFQRWNGFSRVDVVRSQSIRGLPGSGFRCQAQPPPQLGLTVDGDDLNYISHVEPGFLKLPFTDCLLTALPYRLRSSARALVLEPSGGFDVLTALAEGAVEVTAVEPNPLIVEAVREQGAWAGDIYDDPRVKVILERGRTYARRAQVGAIPPWLPVHSGPGGHGGPPLRYKADEQNRYDVVALSLNTPQHTVASGAYSLNENYRYTIEAFVDYLARLDEDGLLMVTRWLQTPPSESIRAFALTVEALERSGGDPQASLVALRSYRQMLILARRGPFTTDELEAIRAFADERAFDLVYAPDIRPQEVNRHNVLPEPDYYRACLELLEAKGRAAWYRAYPFDIEPPTDDRPFFGHFFKWEQAPTVLRMAGHTWQPFGGAGYFVLLALLGLALAAAGVLILLPLAGLKRSGRSAPLANQTLIYFTLLGLGFLCVEIPLLQRFILFLGHPAYAMAVVLFAILLFSGVGSMLSKRVSLRLALILLPALVGGYALGLPKLFGATLALPLWGRLLISVAALAPPGLLMGVGLPKGIALLEQQAPGLIPWSWGVNGAASVVASILAALLALSFGFTVVLALGAACYVGAWITAVRSLLPPPSP